MTRISFKITIEGKPSIEEKFDTALENNPEIQDDLMVSMFSAINMAFRLDSSDQVMLRRFTAEKEIANKAAP